MFYKQSKEAVGRLHFAFGSEAAVHEEGRQWECKAVAGKWEKEDFP